MQSEKVQPPELLEAARRGNEAAFRELVDPWRPGLQAHCYRMLASGQDAEDAVQEAMLRAWRGMPEFEGRSSVPSWLYRIATNVCLNLLERQPRRVLSLHSDTTAAHGEVPAETFWLEPYPDELLGVEDRRATPDVRYELRESVELAFVAALQDVPGNQRAALILRDVLGFSAREVATMMQTTIPSVTSALQHARKRIDERRGGPSQQVTLRSLGDEQLRSIVMRYSDALEQGDVDAIVGLLTQDATWSMPPTPRRFQGHAEIVSFLTSEPFTLRWRSVPTRASGQLAVGSYRWNDQRGIYIAEVLNVLTLRGELISAVTSFIDRKLMRRLGLPDELTEEEEAG